MVKARVFRLSRAFTIFVVSISIFSETLLLNVIVPILPFILRERLSLNDVSVQEWSSILLAAHGFAMIIGSLLFGWIGDGLSDQKLPFLLSLVLPACATILFSVGLSPWVLLMARLLQGFSGAAVFTFGRTLLLQKVGHERLGETMGYTGMATSAGLLLGPVIGGALFELIGSQAVFFVPAGIVAAETVLRFLLIDSKSFVKKEVRDAEAADTRPESGLSTDQSKDQPDTISNSAQEHPMVNDQPSSEDQPLLGGGSRRRNPLLVLLTRLEFIVALFSSFILNGLANGFDAILPTYTMDEFNLTTSQVALFFLCIGTPMILSPLAGHLTDRYGSKVPLVTGLSCLTPCLFLLQYINQEIQNPLMFLGILLVLVGSGLCLAMQPLPVVITNAVKDIEEETPNIFGPLGAYSRAYGLLNMTFAAGAMVGPIFTGFLCAALGWQWTLLVMSVLSCMVLSLVVLMATLPARGRHFDEE